ncbi:MAG: hypothetical protein COA88_15750 [Kordia sp.]|nr:MAG: hypothetical protein COA88_15750 [Kordia sp.]
MIYGTLTLGECNKYIARTKKQIEATTDKELIKVYTDSLRKIAQRRAMLIELDQLFNNKNVVVIFFTNQAENDQNIEALVSCFKAPVFIDVKCFEKDDKIYWSEVNENTDVIIIKDIKNTGFNKAVNYCVSSHIIINKQSQKPFEISTPKVIITTDLETYLHNKLDPITERRIMFWQL